MNVIEFLRTIYVGDRGCKSVVIDGWNAEVKIQATCISRVRSATWDYYTAEDMPDGFIVFEGVESVAFEPSGVIPNDSINSVTAELAIDAREKYHVVVSVDSVDRTGNRTEDHNASELDSVRGSWFAGAEDHALTDHLDSPGLAQVTELPR